MEMTANRTGEPVNFQEYQGQEGLKERITLRLNAMKRGGSFKALFHAAAGQGKTTLVRVIASEMIYRQLADHYIETIAGRFETKADLDYFMRHIKPYTIIFIDEIHGLPGVVRDALYPAIQDNLYSYNESMGSKQLPVGISWLGATTDLGKVHPALQRRLMPMALAPLTKLDRMWIALLQPMPVDMNAAHCMAERCWSPWEIKDELYATSVDIAISHKDEKITLEYVEEACDLLGIDQYGLRPKEREVLSCLYEHPKQTRGAVVYAMAKAPLVVMAGLDDKTFTNAIEPKLLKAGFISVGQGVGRTLTEKAIKAYFEPDSL